MFFPFGNSIRRVERLVGFGGNYIQQQQNEK